MARVLPAGRVTFAFTDVVGSTRAFTDHGQAFADALPVLMGTIGEVTATHGGVVVKTEGDGAFLAFPTAAGAARALREVQQRLEQRPPEGLWLRIRAGAHTADAEPVGDDYLALGVHVAARVSAAAGAGQVLVTSAVVAELESVDREPAVDVGTFELKDIREPMRLWRLAGDDAPPRAASARRTNVAEPITSFVGREVEIDELDRLLETPGLVTVVGAGGIGKTRLVSEYAVHRASDVDGGIWLVELAPVAAPDVVAAVAHVFGAGGAPTVASIASELSRRGEPLLVLDNCEHVADAAADLVSGLIDELPRLRLLATSREPLDVHGERVQRLGPLPVATALFTARASSAGVRVRPEDDEAVTGICDLLDGLPLAVELAAARSATLTPSDLLDALRQGHIELRRRGGPGRQRSLESLVGWSLDLLDGPHRDALLVLSVIPDRFDPAMARALVAAVPGLPAQAPAELARRSLLDLDGTEYRMLVTIRDVARAELSRRPELDESARRALFGWAVARSDHPETPETVSAWEARAMESTLEWAVPRRLEGCGKVMGEVTRWAVRRARLPAALALARMVLEQPPPANPDEVRLKTAAVRMIAGLGFTSSVPEEEVRGLVAAARAGGDADTLRYATGVAASVLVVHGHADEALQLERECLSLTHHDLLRAQCVLDLGFIHHLRGEFEDAERFYREALELTLTDDFNGIVAKGNLGELLIDAGRFDDAVRQLRDALTAARGHPVLAAWTFGLLALAEAGRGATETARTLGRQAAAELEEAVRSDETVGYVLERLRETMARIESDQVVRQAAGPSEPGS